MSSIEVFRTSQANPTERISPLPPLTFQPQPTTINGNPDFWTASILIDAATRYQTIEGFGGAFTEASALTLQKMSPANQARIIRDYFDPEIGNGYTLGRLAIHSCDFALGNYDYCSIAPDPDLTTFSIDHDRAAIIPFVQEAARVAGRPLQLFASPWSPPAWMKDTGLMNRGGRLLPEYRALWALYYCRFFEEYRKAGIEFWGLTVQNEPEASQPWDSCIYTAEEERDFVRDHLGPTLQREGWGDLKLIIWDHNRDRMFERAKIVYDDPEAAKYVWGTGFHWYVADCFENLQRLHEVYPDKQLIFTEGCVEGAPLLDGELHPKGKWSSGERYARNIIQDLNHWTVAWCDWNLLLDETGGPNHVNNLCSAPIMLDTRVSGGTIVYQNSYYYIGHFSRFIRPGSQRILAAVTHDDLETTAFLDPENRVVVVVLNCSDKSHTFQLKYQGQSALTEGPAHSITTYRFAS